MKQKFYPILTLLLLVIMGISAANVSADITPSGTSITFGGTSQERSNPVDDNGPKVVTNTKQVSFDTTSLQPDERWRLFITSITPDPKYSVPANLKLSQTDLVKSELESNPGLLLIEVEEDAITRTDASATLRALIPSNLDAINTDFRPQAFRVAQVGFKIVNVTSSACNVPQPPATCQQMAAGTVEVQMQAENILKISDLKAEINSRERQSVDDADTIKNRKPGDSIDFEVEVENKASDRTNLDVQDSTLDFNCNNDDIDIDDESVDLGDVNADDKETESLKADLASDAKDRNIACSISADGLDANGAHHGEIRSFKVEIKRKNHDVQIQSLSVSPASLACTDSSFQLTLSTLNLGTSNEDQVAAEIFSKPLAIQQRIYSNRELNENDQDVDTVTIAVDPKNIKPGTYAIQAQTFYDNVKPSDTEIVQIENACTESGNGQPINVPPIQQPTNVLSLEETEFQSARSAIVSIPVRVSNTETEAVEYSLTIENTNEFGEQQSTKTVFLNPGQTSTVILNMKVKSDITDGKYSGTVRLTKGDNVLDETQFVVDVSGGEALKKTTSNGGLNLSGTSTTNIFWIIGDIVLVVIAIFFIRLIFTAGSKRRNKKMADYESETKRR